MNMSATQQLTQTQVFSLRSVGKSRLSAAARRTLMEYLPFAYIATGFTAFFATLYVPEWYWVLPYYFLSGCGLLHLAMHFGTGKKSPSPQNTD